jgi:hypothetical protein
MATQEWKRGYKAGRETENRVLKKVIQLLKKKK